MGLETMITFMAVMIVAMAWYANNSKRNKIYCTFRRINKTKISKFVPMKSRYIIFDNKKYDIITGHITFEWWNKGLINQLFPQWVATLDYSHDSRFPHDPNQMSKNWETPEVRNAINKEEWVKSYAKGFTPPASSKKASGLAQYLPIASVLLVVLVGFYLYTNMQELANQMAIMDNMIRSIAR